MTGEEVLPRIHIARALTSGRVPYPAAEAWRIVCPERGTLILGSDKADLRGWGAGQVPGWGPVAEAPGFYGARRGRLEGAGEWTHICANPANTANSGDALVRGTAFDLQWMGPPGSAKVVNRHWTPMGPLFKAGRLFIPGMDYLTVLDAYNGTGTSVQWKENIHEMADANRAYAHFA